MKEVKHFSPDDKEEVKKWLEEGNIAITMMDNEPYVAVKYPEGDFTWMQTPEKPIIEIEDIYFLLLEIKNILKGEDKE